MRLILNCFLLVFLVFCNAASSADKSSDNSKKNFGQFDSANLEFDPMKPILSSVQIDKNIILPRDFYIGDPSAQIAVVDYSSFACGHCYQVYKEILSKLSSHYIKNGKVVLIIREFPLDLRSMQASQLFKCYESKLDKSVDYENLFKILDGLFNDLDYKASDDSFMESLYKFGKDKMGIDEVEVKDCIQSEKIKKYILCSKFFGLKNLGINGTPAIYVNGRQYNGNLSFESFEKFMLESAVLA